MAAPPLLKASPTFLGIPAELRVNIYAHLFDDLIEELSDNLFAVLQLYDSLYDYTAPHLESHVGRTGLTPVLRTCKLVHEEALTVLCERAEFVVNVVADPDTNDKERSSVRFSEGSRHLEFAKHMKVNFSPKDDGLVDKYIGRIDKFLKAIHYGVNLRSLKIMFDVDSRVWRDSMEKVFTALETLRTNNSVKVYLGNINEFQVSDERLTLLLDAINGDNMGRGHHVLGPTHYGEESDEEADDEDY